MLSESEIIPVPLKQLQLIKGSQLNKKVFNHFVMTYEATVQHKIKKNRGYILITTEINASVFHSFCVETSCFSL